MALVLVLGAMVLLSVLILAFMASVSLERVASGSQLNQTEARVLSENVLSLVTAQIRDASTRTNTVWASQPGLIRTYSSTGNITYKLYSAQDMVATSFNPSANTDISTSWSSLPDQFVDLNTPVSVTSGNSTVKYYPILDPGLAWNSSNSTGIKGFINNSPSAGMVASGSNANPIPMPVRWLYMLQDGTLQAMDSSGKVTLASTANPIVGRVAFWTDDESCKININTASQGTFWDVPRGMGNWFERGDLAGDGTFNVKTGYSGLAVSMPYQKEFQRYPGHPATTSLGVILNATNPATGTYLFWPGVTNTTQRGELIYQLIPRVNGGGSMGGTIGAITNAITGKFGALTSDTNRLYASVDELAFSGAFSGTSRTNNISTTNTNSGISVDSIRKLNFFLTANSRSPEVNLFNKPRVTCWPVSVNDTNRTIFDKAITFCSTISGTNGVKTSLIFTRNTMDDSIPSGNWDLMRTNGATVLGSQNPTNDFSAKNSEIYKYLENQIQQTIPGLSSGGATLANSWGSDAGNILTYIYDYIRCINLYDQSSTNTPKSSPYTGRPTLWNEFNQSVKGDFKYQSTPLADLVNFSPPSGVAYYAGSMYSGQVVPIKIRSNISGNQTVGFGRFPVVTGAALIALGAEPASKPLKIHVLNCNLTSGNRTINIIPDHPNLPATDVFSLPDSTGRWEVWSSNTTIQGNLTTITSSTQIQIDSNATVSGNNTLWFKYNNSSGPSPIYPAGQSGTNTYPASKVQLALQLTIGCPSPGGMQLQQTYSQAISGLDALNIKGDSGSASNLYFPASDTNSWIFRQKNNYGNDTTPEWRGQNTSPYFYADGSYIANRKDGSTSWGTNQSANQYYPFISKVIPINNSSTITVGGGANADQPVTIAITTQVAGVTVHTTQMEIPSFTAPSPKWSPYSYATNGATVGSGYWTPTTGQANYFDRFRQRYYNEQDAGGNCNNALLPDHDGDVIRQIELKSGDMRQVSGLYSTPKDRFTPHADYFNLTNAAHSLKWDYGNWPTNIAPGKYGKLVSGNAWNNMNGTNFSGGYAAVPSTLTNGVMRADGGPGDWDIGIPNSNQYGQAIQNTCGGLINKTDDSLAPSRDASAKPTVTFFKSTVYHPSSEGSFSPNRMMPSPVMFGSIPTGVAQGKAWQTLLFRPNGQTSGNHPGAGVPVTGPPWTTLPDHLILDLFTMPVVEPYPISEPFSTAGKINMNYQIAPFTYITRDTGMRAALDAIRVTAVPADNAQLYKYGTGGSTSNPNDSKWADQTINYRYPIDADSTLLLFADRFASNKPFISASEICNMFLVPKPEKITGYAVTPTQIGNSATNANDVLSYMTNFWQASSTGGAGTADNLRERPYVALYPRLTTKSNTYTVHLRVQSLKKRPGSDPQTFDQTKDTVTSEYRGSFMIERFLDPNASTFDITNTNSTLGPYKFRVINTKQFSP